MPNSTMKKQDSKQFSIIDETAKTKNKSIKRKPKSKFRGLRKQLQNDEILKNYFVLDNHKDQLTTFRIDKNDIRCGYSNIVTEHVQSLGESISEESIQELRPPLHVSNQHISNNYETTSFLPPNPNQQQEEQQLNLFLLQLFSLLVQSQHKQH